MVRTLNPGFARERPDNAFRESKPLVDLGDNACGDHPAILVLQATLRPFGAAHRRLSACLLAAPAAPPKPWPWSLDGVRG